MKIFTRNNPVKFKTHLSILVVLLVAISGCIPNDSSKPWTKLIPAEAPVTYVPQTNQTLDSLFTSKYIPFLNDITASSVRLISEISAVNDAPLPVRAVYLFPSSANQWKPVWITRGNPSYVKKLQKKFREQYTQNEYFFKEQRIRIIHLKNREVFVTRLGSWILLSENSLALEESIRSYTDIAPPLNVKPKELNDTSLILNVPYLDQWVKQLAQVTYRPSIDGVFKGTRPAILDVQKKPSSTTNLLTLDGKLPIKPNQTSPLVESITTRNESFQLDNFIPSKAAGYGIFHLMPSLAPPKSVPHPSDLDSLLLNNASLYQRIAESLHSEFAMTMFAQSGYLSKGEHFFMRRLSNRSRISEKLELLEQKGLVNQTESIYNINSRVLALLFGSPLCTFDDFYAGFANNVLVLSKRRGLTQSVISDWRRGRVKSGQKMHQSILEDLNPPLSALVVAEGRSFLEFIEPYLSPDHYVDALTSQFDVLSMSFKKRNKKETAFQLNTYKLPETTAPYREKWAYTLSGTELTGPATLADIGGSPREEIIFSTQAGQVHGLASDGTEILQVMTENDTPVGSPIVYDWYGNGQNIILQAAGNKIYGWNTRGNSLPQFPMILEETIAAPPHIADVNRDGMPELMVSTSNRKVHILNGRGENIAGWPQKVNSIINTSPVFKKINQHWSVLAFAANTLHAWLPDGNLRPGFPKFIQATFRGKPAVYNNHIFGNAADGHLYAISEHPPFADSLKITPPGSSESDSVKISSIQISQEGLVGTPSTHMLSLKPQREDTLQSTSAKKQSIKDTYLLTASSGGSVYFLKTSGAVRQVYNIDQSLTLNSDPFIGDLQNDGKPEVLVNSRFGRLFTWNLTTGRRNFTLPTQSMKYPLLTDIDGDGNMDLIAQSQNGIRCWSLLNP